jgi:hypothetical protein
MPAMRIPIPVLSMGLVLTALAACDGDRMGAIGAEPVAPVPAVPAVVSDRLALLASADQVPAVQARLVGWQVVQEGGRLVVQVPAGTDLRLAARQLVAASGVPVRLLVRQGGAEGTIEPAVAIMLKPGHAAPWDRLGLAPRPAATGWIVETDAAEPFAAPDLARQLQADPAVASAEPQIAYPRAKR